MKTIKHFKFPEQANNLYRNEASSTIALSKLTADKINELVDAYNTLAKGNLEKDQEQDGRISKAVLYMKDNLVNSIHDMLELFLNSGRFDKFVSESLIDGYSKIYNTVGDIINVKNFGAFGDGLHDDTLAIKNAIADAKTKVPCTLYFPKGEYIYTDLGNLAIEGLAIVGEHGYKSTVLRCINMNANHHALKFDAFENSTTITPFCYGLQVRNIHVMGNENTDSAFYIRGCVHSVFENIYAGECRNAVFNIGGVMASAFYNLNTMNRNYKKISTIPDFGCLIDTATRGGEPVGASTNNTFMNCYFEDCETGLHLVWGDQNTFTGCAFEYNTKVGVKLEANARMTLFNACGIENNPENDYIDNGRLTKLTNSYVQYVATIGGSNCTVENCLIDSMLVGGLNNEIRNVRFKYHAYSDTLEPFTDNGIGTIVQNLFNIKTAKNVYPKKARKSFSVPAGGLEYKNETEHIVEIYCAAGTLTTAQMKREGENWLALNTSVPNKWVLRPGETFNVTYTGTPALSYIETYER